MEIELKKYKGNSKKKSTIIYCKRCAAEQTKSETKKKNKINGISKQKEKVN